MCKKRRKGKSSESSSEFSSSSDSEEEEIPSVPPEKRRKSSPSSSPCPSIEKSDSIKPRKPVLINFLRGNSENLPKLEHDWPCTCRFCGKSFTQWNGRHEKICKKRRKSSPSSSISSLPHSNIEKSEPLIDFLKVNSANLHSEKQKLELLEKIVLDNVVQVWQILQDHGHLAQVKKEPLNQAYEDVIDEEVTDAIKLTEDHDLQTPKINGANDNDQDVIEGAKETSKEVPKEMSKDKTLVSLKKLSVCSSKQESLPPSKDSKNSEDVLLKLLKMNSRDVRLFFQERYDFLEKIVLDNVRLVWQILQDHGHLAQVEEEPLNDTDLVIVKEEMFDEVIDQSQ